MGTKENNMELNVQAAYTAIDNMHATLRHKSDLKNFLQALTAKSEEKGSFIPGAIYRDNSDDQLFIVVQVDNGQYSLTALDGSIHYIESATLNSLTKNCYNEFTFVRKEA